MIILLIAFPRILLPGSFETAITATPLFMIIKCAIIIHFGELGRRPRKRGNLKVISTKTANAEMEQSPVNGRADRAC